MKMKERLLADPALQALRGFIRTALLTNKPLNWLAGETLLKAHRVLVLDDEVKKPCC